MHFQFYGVELKTMTIKINKIPENFVLLLLLLKQQKIFFLNDLPTSETNFI
jgi:hypothetical protein